MKQQQKQNQCYSHRITANIYDVFSMSCLTNFVRLRALLNTAHTYIDYIGYIIYSSNINVSHKVSSYVYRVGVSDVHRSFALAYSQFVFSLNNVLSCQREYLRWNVAMFGISRTILQIIKTRIAKYSH